MPDAPRLPADASLEQRLRALAEEALEGSALYLVDLAVRGRPGGRVVEVAVEADAGAGADDIAAYSRRLSFLLDTEDPIKGRYRLDVTTPGADRPVRVPRQYRRLVGRDVRLTLADAAAPSEAPPGGSPAQPLTGRLLDASDTGLALQPEGAAEPLLIPYDAIREARVVLPW
ncbi:MAG: ribosome maturation factor RimP [Rubricoccaceae bacterium]